MSTSLEPSTGSSSEEMKKCFSLLEEGEKIIRTDQKDALLVLGNTGSGKTTLVQFLAGNNTELSAEETSPGEFIIVDTKNKISTYTVVSKTIFPDLTIDREYNIGIYDCPGFVDTRGAAVDIAGTYFIRKVINSIEQVKIFLTVNYTSVRKGVDRGDFLEMVRQVLSLIKNVDKYCDSVAIVVTKVDNTYVKNKLTRTQELVSDDTVQQAVAKFLETFRENVRLVSDEIFSARAIKLVNALLTKNGTSYEKIGIFRRPDEAGPLSQSDLLQDGKRFMKKIIMDKLRFASVHPNDFGYAISDRSKNEVKDLIEEINKMIKTNVLEVCTEIEVMVNNNHQHVKDIREFEKFLTNVQNKINSFQESVSYETNLKDFLRKLLDLIVDLRVNASKKSLSDIVKQGKYLDFLELVSERKVEGSSLMWTEGFRHIKNYLHEMKEWYSFLNQFYNRLSSYEIQNSKSKFSYLYENTISSLADEKIKQFAKSQPGFNITSSLEVMKLDAIQIQTVNNLITSTLNTSISMEYDEGTKRYIVTGDYIILSDIDKSMYFSEYAEVISIFASNKIFIDKNITSTTNLNTFAMIAPTEEVIGTQRIILDGEDGVPFPPHYQKNQLAGADGEKGIPGLPGNPGANFFAVTQNFVNSESLTISSNGGQGGRGQDGADGVAGQDGQSPLEYTSDGRCKLSTHLDWFKRVYKSGLIFREYCSIGARGSDGGNGGHGGIGGHGGLPGIVALVTFDGRKPLSTVLNKSGSEGQVGLGGKGGAGGEAGTSVNTERFLFWWNHNNCNKADRLARNYGDCSDDDYLRNGSRGENGSAGVITEPSKPPERKKPAPNGAVLMKYKEFMRQRLILDNFNQHEKYQFLKSLDQNSVLIKSFSVTDLVTEFISLENEYLNLSLDFNWLDPYEQLLKLVEFQLTTSEHQVLSTLQKAIISKLCLLKVRPQKNLITQVLKYLDSEETSLKHFLKEDESLLILNDNCTKLQKELVKSFLEVQGRAQPMANKIATMTDVVWERIKNFVDELVTDKYIKTQEEKQQQLQKNLILLKVLHSIRETAQFLNAMSKFGSEIVNITRLSNKYNIQNGSYESAILKLQEILLQILQSQTKDVPEQLRQILVDAMNHKEIPNDIKNLLKRFTEVAKKPKNLNEILEMRKIRRDLLRIISDSNLKNESLLKIVKTIEVFFHIEDATILAIGGETTAKRAEILAATLHKATAYDQIHFYEEKLHSLVEQVFSDISSHLVDEIVDTSRTSKQKYFEDIKLLLQQLQKSAKLPEELGLIFQQLLVDVNIISTTYDSLSYFQEYERLLVMKKDIPMSQPMPLISNSELKNMVDTLGIITESNLVLGEYRVCLKNMEQIVFPLGNLYEREFSEHSGITNNVINITSLAVHKLQTMKSTIDKQGLYLDPDHAKLVFDGEFKNHENSLGAFYIWKNQDHKKAIEDLLAGKEVTLKSDIVNGVANDAVKFSSIRIKFTCKDEIMQSELDEDMQNLQISMVHGEDSYYRCGNKFYRFTFDQQELTYSYRLKENGEPAVKNSLYDDIKNGASILSPYTQWNIQLKGGNFEKLAKYKDRVDIELEGEGKWIKDNGLLCGNYLQKYYTVDDTISEANAVEDDCIDLSKVQLTNEQLDSKMPQLHRVARSLVEPQSELRHFIDAPPITQPYLESMPKQIEMVNGQQKQVSFYATAQTSLNNCLLLLDLLVRRFTNVKSKYFDHCSTSYLHGKLCSVEIVREFDMLVESLCDYPHQYDVDPVPLMELISKDIVNQNGRNIAEILLKSVQSDGSPVPDEFCNQLRSKMT